MNLLRTAVLDTEALRRVPRDRPVEVLLPLPADARRRIAAPIVRFHPIRIVEHRLDRAPPGSIRRRRDRRIALARQVTLPAGTWYPLLGGPGLVFADGESKSVSAGLEAIPAFVPAGTLLVLLPRGIDTLVEAGVRLRDASSSSL